MKERWGLARAHALKRGNIICWHGRKGKVIEVGNSIIRPEMVGVFFANSSLWLLKDEYVPVLLTAQTPPVLPVPPRTMTIADHRERYLRPIRTVLGAPPEPPAPPPFRYERYPHFFGSWWDNLKDWLNGR